MERTRDLPLLLIVPPAVVVVTLLVLHSVWATFLIYHLGLCILAPLLATRDRHRYVAAVGLSGGRVRAGVIAGLGLGAAMAAAQFAALTWGADLIFTHERVIDSLSAWGAGPDRAGPLLLIMLAVNGPAEEVYWRGYIRHRLVRLPIRRAITLAALAYASYHGITLYALFGSVPMAAAILAVVFGTGCFWGWLTERYGNVWPALLSHGGATLGYMVVYWDRFAAG